MSLFRYLYKYHRRWFYQLICLILGASIGLSSAYYHKAIERKKEDDWNKHMNSFSIPQNKITVTEFKIRAKTLADSYEPVLMSVVAINRRTMDASHKVSREDKISLGGLEKKLWDLESKSFALGGLSARMTVSNKDDYMQPMVQSFLDSSIAAACVAANNLLRDNSYDGLEQADQKVLDALMQLDNYREAYEKLK